MTTAVLEGYGFDVIVARIYVSVPILGRPRPWPEFPTTGQRAGAEAQPDIAGDASQRGRYS
jgi:hypothetical protein